MPITNSWLGEIDTDTEGTWVGFPSGVLKPVLYYTAVQVSEGVYISIETSGTAYSVEGAQFSIAMDPDTFPSWIINAKCYLSNTSGLPNVTYKSSGLLVTSFLSPFSTVGSASETLTYNAASCTGLGLWDPSAPSGYGSLYKKGSTAVMTVSQSCTFTSSDGVALQNVRFTFPSVGPEWAPKDWEVGTDNVTATGYAYLYYNAGKAGASNITGGTPSVTAVISSNASTVGYDVSVALPSAITPATGDTLVCNIEMTFQLAL